MSLIRPGAFLIALAVGTLSGCAHTPSCGPIAPRPAVSGFGPCDCGPTPTLPRRFQPAPVIGSPGLPPAGSFPPTGELPPGNVPPPFAPPGGLSPEPSRTLPPDDGFRGYPPSKPAPEANVKPYAPPILGDLRDPRATLRPPQVGEQQRPGEPGKEGSTLPVDIPQFAFARKQVASGQKPFIDGLDWLRDKGYRTVLHVRAPGEDDAAARAQFTAKGIRYLSMEVSPTTLSKDALDEFNQIVTDPANLPLFVYDRDSSVLGGLWYLHFRIHEGQDPERAAIKAGELGLNVDADGGAHREMWLAVQRYLQMSKPTNRPSARVHTAVWQRAR